MICALCAFLWLENDPFSLFNEPELSTCVQIIFWTAVVAIFYTYAGYPLLLMLISRLRGKPVRRREFTPPVTVIIAAYNEERDIAQKLENTLALDYPAEQLEIIVASDGSNDGTNAIVERYDDPRVQFYPFPRQGKIPVLNAVVGPLFGPT